MIPMQVCVIRGSLLLVICLFLASGCEDSSLPDLDALASSDTDATDLLPSSVSDLAEVEQQTYVAVNQHRAGIGAGALTWSESMAALARQHSQEIASGAIGMGHVGAPQRAASLQSSLGIETFGENEAMTPGVYGALNAWLDSPAHRANMERSFTITGVGAALQADGRYVITQLFGGF
jgi:uncharacterized protein YkwD